MFARIFSPTLSYRLFDPMPLPRIMRIHRRIIKKNPVKAAIKKVHFARKIRRIPVNS